MENQPPEDLSESAKPDHELPKISISDGIVLAALTLFSYLFHYFFEYGYLSYFDIPAAFISFNLPEMIPAIFFLVLTYFIFVFVLWPYIRYLWGILPGFIKTILIFLPWLIIFVITGFSWAIILLIFFVFLLIFGIEKFRSDRARKTAGSVMDLEPNQSQTEREKILSFETKTSFNPLVNKIIPIGNRLPLYYFLFLALVGSIALGRTTAATRTSFLVPDTSPRCAVVYTTADRFICKPLDANNAFEDSFIVSYFQDNQNIEFREENIGPLRPKTTAAPTYTSIAYP